jgi:hypothetical protein
MHEKIENIPLETVPEINPHAKFSVAGLKSWLQSRRQGSIPAYDVSEMPATEAFPNTTAKFEPQIAESYITVSSYLTDDAFYRRIESADKQLASPELAAIGTLIEEREAVHEAESAALRARNQQLAQSLEQQSHTLYERIASSNQAQVSSYYTARAQRRGAEHGMMEVYDTDPDAQGLVALLDDLVEKANTEAQPNAPFAHYKDNDEVSWQYVPDSTIKDFLSERRFMHTDHLAFNRRSIMVRAADRNKPFRIPLNNIVYAQGFDSWLGRGSRGNKGWSSQYGAGTMNSLTVIKHYAGLSTEIPPVEHIRLFVQPDGQIFGDNGSGDSHRIGAAILRGQGEIEAERVTFIPLDSNVLPSPQSPTGR